MRSRCVMGYRVSVLQDDQVLETWGTTMSISLALPNCTLKLVKMVNVFWKCKRFSSDETTNSSKTPIVCLSSHATVVRTALAPDLRELIHSSGKTSEWGIGTRRNRASQGQGGKELHTCVPSMLNHSPDLAQESRRVAKGTEVRGGPQDWIPGKGKSSLTGGDPGMCPLEAENCMNPFRSVWKDTHAPWPTNSLQVVGSSLCSILLLHFSILQLFHGELGWCCSKEKAWGNDLTAQMDSSAFYLFMLFLVSKRISSCLQLC